MSNPTAAIIIIGNEILSGRTLDTNTQYIAKRLSELGIILLETRTIPDDHDVIVNVILNIKSKKYDYIFTTGGIGPTHDDITSQAIADALNVPLELNQQAYKLIKDFYTDKGMELNKAREKMAYLPRDCSLINNPVSSAPGFIIQNIFVMAGVPHIMQAMFESLSNSLRKGDIIKSRSIDVMIGESSIAAELCAIQDKYNDVAIGSYPFEIDNKHGTSLVLRSVNMNQLEESYLELESLVKKFV